MQNWQKCMCLYTVMLSLVFCLLGCVSNDVKKAQEFMDAGMYAQAMELLSKRIGEKPSDPNVHFLMGICNIHTNNDRAANDRFASAVRLKPDYGFKIGDEYRKAGNETLTNGDISRALNLYLQAVNYQPGLKDKIGTELLAEGKSFFEKERHKMAAARFTAANGIKPELGTTIAEYYYQAGKNHDVPLDLQTLCFDNAVKYYKKTEYVQAHADRHYELSKTAKTTEGAIKELKIANKFGGKYGLELKKKQQQLEHEKFMAVVKKTEKERGKAKYLYVTTRERFEPAGAIPKSSKVIYLSTYDFRVLYDTGKKSTWKAAPVEENWKKIHHSKEMSLSFGIVNNPTHIYYWVEGL
ncbi:MAG: tetratricopeptide repeat protein [Desulfobacula sp.]|nr:tetratricopeptide repeat protein [Desulfobacula sp.]